MKDKEAKKVKEVGMMRTHAGKADTYSLDANRTLQWSVAWKQSAVDLNTAGATSGALKDVTATIYSGAHAGSTVTADSAEGDKFNKVLNLDGHVVVLSKDRKSKLTCDHLQYLADRRRYRALGNVRFAGPVGSIGTFSQLIANSDLTKVATPKDFDR